MWKLASHMRPSSLAAHPSGTFRSSDPPTNPMSARCQGDTQEGSCQVDWEMRMENRVPPILLEIDGELTGSDGISDFGHTEAWHDLGFLGEGNHRVEEL